MAQKTLTVKLAFSKSDVQIVHTRYGVELSLKGAQIPTQPGAPGFPVRVVEAALPEGTEASRISCRVVRTEPLTCTPTFVAPVREKGISPANVQMPEGPVTRWVPPEPRLYEEALKDMARRTAWLTGTRTEGRIIMAGVAVYPIRYDETGCLELVNEVKITVTLRPIEVKHPRLLRAEARPSWSARRHLLAARSAVNPEIIEKLHAALGTAAHAEIDVHPPGGTSGIPMNGSIPVQVPRFVDYLIITDDSSWDAGSVTAMGSVGDLPGVFARLSDWKRDRGLRTHVACLGDIVGGSYGDFTTGARDLQEVIRNFLKDFVWRHDTDWVLLGGGVDIIPARRVCGGIMDGCFGFAESEDALSVNTVAWKDTFLGMRVDAGAFGDSAKHALTMLESGGIVPYDPAGPSGASSPRWYHTTDDTFATFSATRTAFIRVDGDPDVINGKVQWYRYENMIPSDLYYASLYAPTYNIPGRHDWDLTGNGLYGQWSESENLDGVDYWGDVYIGRAPVENVGEADVFVDKVIAYEKAGERPADYYRFNRMLHVAEHFGDVYKYGNILRESGDPLPPKEIMYSYDAARSRVLLNAPVAKTGVDFDVVCYVSGSDYRVIPYDAGAGNGKRGWYFAKSWDDTVPSEFSFPFLSDSFKIPVPTQWIVIYSGDTAELMAELITLDEKGLDGSIREQEDLRDLIAKNVPSISEVRRLYSHEKDLSATAVSATPLKHLDSDALRAELSDGPHLVSMSGHGWYGGCCQFNKAVLDSLTNGDRTFIVFADSCFTNEFDYTDPADQLHKAISRYALVAPNGGAVAYVGYSRFGWQANGPVFLLGFFERFIHFGRHHLGMLHADCYALASHHIDDAAYRWTGLAQNLMGDPEMPVFRDEADLRIKYVANKRTKELHERNCPWVEKMWIGNKLYLEEKEWALSHGYDGCAFCLNEHHMH